MIPERSVGDMDEKTAKAKVEKRAGKLIAIAQAQLRRGNLEKVLNTVATCGLTLYSANQCYKSHGLENLLSRVAEQLPFPETEIAPVEDRVLFYDGFGLGSRGLLTIYLQALCSFRKVTFVTRRDWTPGLEAAISLVESCGGQVCLLEGKKKTEDIRLLQKFIAISGARHLFMYANADDVVVTTAFLTVPKDRVRYQINLTDHAFWLGSQCADKYIEFRDYGGAISSAYREIPKEKLVKLPFYPRLDQYKPFGGFPGEFDPEKQQLVFSGGALYKTQSADNAYYRLAEQMLRNHPNVVFWYAGSGDSTQLDLLKKAFPQRVWHTPERQDLFGILEHCLFYLSTYPVCGGLMFQYAAAAGKVPVTLRHDDISDGFLLDQRDLGIEFETIEQTLQEIKKLVEQPDYRREKEEKISRSVLDPDTFAQRLQMLLETGDTGLSLDYTLPDVQKLQNMYLKNYTAKQLRQDLVRKGNGYLFVRFPVDYTGGLVRKLRKKWKP